jgi:hypothetical protein
MTPPQNFNLIAITRRAQPGNWTAIFLKGQGIAPAGPTYDDPAALSFIIGFDFF